jgi:hypothetical protein
LSAKSLRHACASLLASFVFATFFFTSLSASQSIQTQEIRRGLYRGRPVTYTMKNGKAIFEGDIILEKVSPLDTQHVTPSYGIDYSQYLWPLVGTQYQIPYVIASGSGNTTTLNSAIAQFNATFSNIQFVAYTNQTDYVSFYFDPNNTSGECEAVVGRQGGEQQVGGSATCTLATVLHELGHTIGLWHEQSRPDRNTYVSVNYDNLIKGSISNFNQIYDNAQTFGTYYDYASIMEYPAFSFSRNGGPAIESIPAGIPLSNQNGYSTADIDGIERLYGHAPTQVTVTSNPPGLQVIVDGTTVTTPQVYSWALYSTHTLNVPSGVQTQTGDIENSTTSTTFYYTYGRWNDQNAASHSITVLPGNGELATPATSPSVTTYTANFIQLVPYAAAIYPTGAGSVTPSPAPVSYTGSSLVFYTARQEVTLSATPATGQNFYEFNNAPYWLPGGLGANPKTFYVPDTGLTVNTTAEFSPDVVYTVNVNPNPFSSNLYIYADGDFWYAPKNFSSYYDSTWTANSAHTLSLDTPEYPYSSNSRYAFTSWSDGTTTTTDDITLPSTSTAYTANLQPQFYVTYYANEQCAAIINISPSSPTGDGFYPTGTEVTFVENPNTGWLFTGWQYDLTGTSSSESLLVTDEALVTADYNTTTTPLTLTSLSPAAAIAGSPSFTLTLIGTGFSATTLVSVDGTYPTVKYISPTELSVTVTAAQIANPGAFQVYVEDFPSGASCAAFGYLPFNVANKPIVSPSPLSLSFGSLQVGTTSAAKTVTVKNTSKTSVSMNSVSVTGDYAISSNSCGASLAAGKSCSVKVTFSPSVSGSLPGSLAVSDSSPDSPQTVALSGTGELPLTFSPTTLAFGTVAVGTTSASKTVTITNNESSTLSYSFAAGGNYAISTTGTTCTGSLAAAAKCNIAVTFTPTATAAINGSLSLSDGSSFSPQVVSLSGTGSGGSTAPLTFTPASVTFATEAVGTTSAAKSVTVKNTSTSSVTLASLAASSDFVAAGTGTKPCAANLNLAANATCTMSITFAPVLGASGSISGSIVITDNAAVAEQTFDVKGTAALPLSFSPTTLSFAAQTVDTTGSAQTVTITNNLSSTISITIAGSGDFEAAPGGSNPCSSSLASKATCTFDVTFTPTGVGTRTSAITITDGATPGVQTLNVSGIGQ